MINLQSDIGPLYYARAILQSLRYIALCACCQIVIISRLLAFGNGTNETACDARNVAHILDGGQRTARLLLLPGPAKHPFAALHHYDHTCSILTHCVCLCMVDLYCTRAQNNMLRVYIIYLRSYTI